MNKTIALLFALLGAASAAAQTPPPPAPAPKPCATPESRQFDFWLGSWNVFQPDGKQAGTNDVTAAVAKVSGVSTVRVNFGVMSDTHRFPSASAPAALTAG